MNTSSAQQKQWNIEEQKSEDVEQLCHALEINPLLAKVLCNRGYTDPSEAGAFLRKETGVFHDPFLLHDMEKAVVRIERAMEAHEKITIYGDYDADGVTATSILYLYLAECGADVHFYIPGRFDEGYGLNMAAIAHIAADGTQLIITVDTGVTAIEEAKAIADAGMDLVITDHHSCRETLPYAAAVINPHRQDDNYPFKDLAGVGVAFKLICALETYKIDTLTEQRSRVKRICFAYAELAAIGTIADVMPLRGENRLLVNIGLALMEQTKKPGIAALLDIPANASPGGGMRMVSTERSPISRQPQKKRKITSSMIAFSIAPRINAAGRIASASRAVELFLSSTAEEARNLAAALCDANTERKETENRIAEEAFLQVETEHDLSKEHILILAGEGWHHGVIGIVASRVTERYHLPSILFSFDQKDDIESPLDEGTGSGRSVDGFCMIDALNDCRDLLVRYGGHALAAGMTLTREKLPEFRRRMEARASIAFSEGVPPQTLTIDCETAFYDITLQTAQSLLQLEPFGIGNPQPLFCLCGAAIQSVTPLSGGKHTKLILEDPENCAIVREALLFGTKTEQFPFVSGDIVDVVYSMDISEFRGDTRVQMLLSDIRPHDADAAYAARQDTLYLQCVEGILPLSLHSQSPENDILPTRDDCRAVYVLLRAWTESGTKEFPCTYTQLAYHTHLGRCKVHLICDMFEETALILRKKSDSMGFTCKLDTTPGRKIDLNAAPLMMKLRQLYSSSGKEITLS
ncbi:MAG: DHH family phosphoesterase [Clostridia bacterium]|nr:DHH family phosphoesterase [Clostridia bacterium]